MDPNLRNALQHYSAYAYFLKENYYGCLDKGSRMALVNLYRRNSKVIWNGKQLKSEEDFRQLLMKLPRTEHKVVSTDVQPLTVAKDSLLINFAGTVKYGEIDQEHSHVFSHTFIIVPDTSAEQQTFYVLYENFRITSTS